MSLFTVGDLEVTEISELLDQAASYRSEVDQSGLGMTVALMFFEPSTRTRLSFGLAASRIGATTLTFDPDTSSVTKGESLRESARTVAAMGVDTIVLRHPQSGIPEKVATWTGCQVVNAGDGRRAHPTQTLADLLTIRDAFGQMSGLNIAVVGDVANSRVARGLIDALPRLGAELTLFGPPGLMPVGPDLRTSQSLDEELANFDIVYLLRVQRERGGRSQYPSDVEYRRRFGLTESRAGLLKSDARVMHAGPFNRGVEIDGPVADGDRSLILDQVKNGVLVRMAVLGAQDGRT